jgi:hypothetical protein
VALKCPVLRSYCARPPLGRAMHPQWHASATSISSPEANPQWNDLAVVWGWHRLIDQFMAEREAMSP